ncbi:MAG: hypothetical protein MZV70_06585 [Desulfobacterales bacterium]|nr:hypothetical protein [Desulfobacterales bacterium]
MTRTSRTATADRIAVWASTPGGAALAARLAAGLPGAEVLVSEALLPAAPAAVPFASFKAELAARFRAYRGHVCVMATGIVVRLHCRPARPQGRGPGGRRGRRGRPLRDRPRRGPPRQGERARPRGRPTSSARSRCVTTATDVNGVPGDRRRRRRARVRRRKPGGHQAREHGAARRRADRGARPHGPSAGRVPGPRRTAPVRRRPGSGSTTARSSRRKGRSCVRPPRSSPASGATATPAPARCARLLLATLQAAGPGAGEPRPPGLGRPQGRRAGARRAGPGAWRCRSASSAARRSGGWRPTCRPLPPACVTTSE